MSAQVLVSTVVSVVSLTLGACKREPPPPPPLQEAPAVTWQPPALTIANYTAHYPAYGGCYGCRVLFFISESELLVRSEGTWNGRSEITIGETKIDGAELAKNRRTFPIVHRLGGLKLVKGSEGQPVAVNLTVRVELPNAKPATATVPSLEVSAYSLIDVFRKVKGGPLRFEGDVERVKPQAAVLYLRSALNPTRLLGTPALVRDVDWVAFAEEKELRKRQCGGYRSVRTGRASGVTVYYYKTSISIFDRRTGKKLGEKEFLPRDGCPLASIGGSTSERPSDKVLQAWVANALKKGVVAP